MNFEIHEYRKNFSKLSDFQTIKLLTQGSKLMILSSTSPIGGKFSTKTTMIEINYVVMEKQEFEYRNQTVIVALFGIFGIP